MTLAETLQVLREGGVSRAKLAEGGSLLEVEFAGAAPEPPSPGGSGPSGIPDAYQRALDALAGRARPEGVP